MKSSDLMLDALHVPLLAMTSSAGVLVLACYFGVLWLALIAAMLVALFMRSAWRRAMYLARRGAYSWLNLPTHEHSTEQSAYTKQEQVGYKHDNGACPPGEGEGEFVHAANTTRRTA